jgi:hypothetical protein
MHRHAHLRLFVGNGTAIRTGEVPAAWVQAHVVLDKPSTTYSFNSSVDFRCTNTQYEVASGNAESWRIGIGARSGAVGACHKESVGAGKRVVVSPGAGG